VHKYIVAVNNNNGHHHVVPAITVNLYVALIIVLTLLAGAFGVKYVHLRLAMDRYQYLARVLGASQVTPDSSPTYAALILEGIAYQQPGQLQAYISTVSKELGKDVVVVDTQKKILADKFPANIGSIYTYDKGNEVTQTLKDGSGRMFFERSPDYPDGIQELVLPIKNAQGTITGALLVQTSR